MELIQEDGRIDWFQVINDLGRRGFPTQLIADTITVPKSTLLGWKQGAEPKHGDGEKLITLWCRVMDHSRDNLPRVGLDAWWAYHSARAARAVRMK